MTRFFAINQTDVVTWVDGKEPYVEADVPIIYGNISDGWDASTTVRLPSNKTIDLVLQVANGSMDTVCHTFFIRVKLLFKRQFLRTYAVLTFALRRWATRCTSTATNPGF